MGRVLCFMRRLLSGRRAQRILDCGQWRKIAGAMHAAWQALAAFRVAAAIEPAQAEANTNAANLLFTLGRADEALPYAERAVAANPQLADAQLNLGLILHALKRYEEAVASLSRAYRIAPT